MKKLLFIALMFASIATYAQKGTAIKLPLAIGDTLVNTGTVTKYLTLTGGYSGVAIQVTGTKQSGTGAGTIGIFGSLDGVNYVQIGTNSTLTNVTTNAFTYYITTPLPNRIKILATGSGTEAMLIKVWYRTPIYQPN